MLVSQTEGCIEIGETGKKEKGPNEIKNQEVKNCAFKSSLKRFKVVHGL